MSMFKKDVQPAANLDLGALLQAALAAPKYPRVYLHPFETQDAFSASAVTRLVAGWAQQNKDALACPNSMEALQAELNDLDSQIDFHSKEILRLRAELIRQTGGQAAVDAAAVAGVDVAYDPAILSGQRENTRLHYELRQQRAEVSGRLVVAQGSEQAKAELVAILAALVGGLQ